MQVISRAAACRTDYNNAVQKSVAVVNAASDERVDEGVQ